MKAVRCKFVPHADKNGGTLTFLLDPLTNILQVAPNERMRWPRLDISMLEERGLRDRRNGVYVG
jgi:hypothetical protein